MLPSGGGDSTRHAAASSSSSPSSLFCFFAELRRRFRWRSFGLMLAACILALQLVSMFLFNVSFFFAFDRGAGIGGPGGQAEIDKFVQRIAADGKLYSPQRSVAFAIPVGGHTERSGHLRRIIHGLAEGGALRQNIFVFEDVQSRANRQPSPQIQEVIDQINQQAQEAALTAQQAQNPPKSGQPPPDASLTPLVGKVSLIHTDITRYKPEDQSSFGLHLARHYKYMLDYMLVGDTNEQLLAHQKALDQRAQAASIGIAQSLGPAPVVGSGTFDFVVVIEDDLELAPDFVKYFQQMSKIMRADDSIYCVAAHQDNAFMATSAEEDRSLPRTLEFQDFAFRRGNHFMAPGWMTSRFIYSTLIKDRWLDERGEYKYKERFHLKNGHWDRFFDALIEGRDCIFPEVPRIIHSEGEGFTVARKGQLELYTNLRLSSLPVETDYGELSMLSSVGYQTAIQRFLREARVLTVLEESTLYRHEKLVYVVEARDDKDGEWNSVFYEYFGLIGVGGYGGYEGYVKVRGIWRGVVLVRWMSNLIMLVGAYSPFVSQVHQSAFYNWGIELKHEGCYPSMMLTHMVKHYTQATVSATKCLLSCLHLGYRYGGVVHASQCGCTSSLYTSSAGDTAQAKPASCSDTCLGAAAHSAIQTTLVQGVTSLLGDKEPCGGELFASLYSVGVLADPEAAAQLAPEVTLAPPRDALYVAGTAGQSCTDACAAAGPNLECSESLFPLLHHSCAALSKLMGCSRCVEESDVEAGFATPGRVSRASSLCTMAKGKYIMCSRKPQADYLRACVCRRTKMEPESAAAEEPAAQPAQLSFLASPPKQP